MQVAGIIAEYNPFHRGHAYQIAQTRQVLGAESAIVCVMSGHWVQAADCAICDKWTRAGLALDGGADLVLELPTVWALSSAEGFARGAVATLAATGLVDHLCFGSESGTLAPLLAAADCLDSVAFEHRIPVELAGGKTYAAARQAAVQFCVGSAADCLALPNNNLGVEYLRALAAQGSRIAPMTVLRRGAAHGAALPGDDLFASATAIRRLLRDGAGAAAERYLLPGALPFLNAPASLLLGERALLARLRTMTRADFAALPDSGDAAGLPARLLRAAQQATSLEQFYALAKMRRYSHARLRRLALWAFLGLRAADRPAQPPYLRVLGANARGRALLRAMERSATAPVITKPAHIKQLSPDAQQLFALESRCTDLYALCHAAIWPCGREWTSNPIMTEK